METTHAMNPHAPVTLCGLELDAMENPSIVKFIKEATCEGCLSSIRNEHLIHQGAAGKTACGGEGITSDNPAEVNCAACAQHIPPTLVMHIGDVVPRRGAVYTLCGTKVRNGVVLVEPGEANCEACLTIRNGVSPWHVFVNPADPMDVVRIMRREGRVAALRDGMNSTLVFADEEGASDYLRGFVKWVEAQGFHRVEGASVEEDTISESVKAFFGSPLELLREWFAWWENTPGTPAKMPQSLHTRTAGLLAAIDR